MKCEEKTEALFIGGRRWKNAFIQRCFSEYRFRFVKPTGAAWHARRFVREHPDGVIVAWGYRAPDKVLAIARRANVPMYRMEDGFVRSVGLGAAHALPGSLVLDKTGTLYFDARAPSGLERILKTHDFDGDPELMQTAVRDLRALCDNALTKYNFSPARISPAVAFDRLKPRESGRKRILAVGQVEADASLAYGLAEGRSNLDLVKQAKYDCPDADLFFKPHPDLLSGHSWWRKRRSTLGQISRYAYVLRDSMTVPEALAQVDHLYTLTSLSGFEAVLRGIPVTVLGCPFYSGWGLTDDRQSISRRGRSLTREQLFAGAYLLYPRYFNTEDGSPSTLAETMQRIIRGLGQNAP